MDSGAGLCVLMSCVAGFCCAFVLFWFECDWKEIEFVRLGCVAAFGIGAVNRSRTVCVLVTVCVFDVVRVS